MFSPIQRQSADFVSRRTLLAPQIPALVIGALDQVSKLVGDLVNDEFKRGASILGVLRPDRNKPNKTTEC